MDKKATGIVRRIDDLGRVVIPKEIRRTMRIREGDPLEIYTDREGQVIFKKYSPMGELREFAAQYAQTLHQIGDLNIAVCDRDSVIAVAGISKRELEGKLLEEAAADLLTRRVFYRFTEGEPLLFVPEGRWISCFAPILCEGDVIGGVASLCEPGSRPDPTETEWTLIRTAAAFLGRQMEG